MPSLAPELQSGKIKDMSESSPGGTDPIDLEAGPLVSALRQVLGTRLVSYLAGADDTHVVNQWADGNSALPPDAQERLQLAYRVAGVATHSVSPRIAQTWFQGMNPQLGDRSPAWVIRHSDPASSAQALMKASWSLAAGG